MTFKKIIIFTLLNYSLFSVHHDQNKTPLKLAIIFLEIKDTEQVFIAWPKNTGLKNKSSMGTSLPHKNLLPQPHFQTKDHLLPKPPLRFPDIKLSQKKSAYDYLARSLSSVPTYKTMNLFSSKLST